MKYSEICPPKRLAVRREEAKAMVGLGRVVDDWIDSGRLIPCNPGAHTPIFAVVEIEQLFARWMVEARTNPSAEYQSQPGQGGRSAVR